MTEAVYANGWLCTGSSMQCGFRPRGISSFGGQEMREKTQNTALNEGTNASIGHPGGYKQ